MLYYGVTQQETRGVNLSNFRCCNISVQVVVGRERSQAFENIIRHFPKVDSFEVVFHQRGGLGRRV